MLNADFTNVPYKNLLKFFYLSLCLLLAGCQFPFIKKGGEASGPKAPPCVVLALPNSGSYSQVAGKIIRGAKIAMQSLNQNGVNASLQEINTEAPNWLATLEALPAECVVVGGPLQDKKYVEARNSGIMQKKIFFAFTPNLMKGDEGKTAWRFFPSAEDQVNALINFATDKLNIRSFGAMYPDDAYGRRMADIFEQALTKRHMSLEKAAYNPSAPATWSAVAEKLIRPIMAEDGKTTLPQTAFEAIFLPDSWKKVDSLKKSLVNNGEIRLVMLGPMLWEQSLAGKKIPNSEKFSLAVFPGAWMPNTLPEALQKANPDFWVALGYDFMNFAVNAALDSVKEPALITAQAQKSASSLRALAPISWNDNGMASQHLYLFQAGPSGITPINIEKFQLTRATVNEKAALRMQGLAPVEENTFVETTQRAPEPVSETAAPAPSAPMQPGSPALSPVPIPSYKLRLPTAP